MSENTFNINNIIPKRGALTCLSFEIVRSLTFDDIPQLANASKLSHRPIQNIKAIHHRLAQLIAKGCSDNEIIQLTGSSISRIAKLKADPTFNELISYYHDQMATLEIEDGQRIQEKLKTAAETALDEITERLEDEDKRKEMPISELRRIVEMGADRTVAPPKASVHLTQTPQQITLSIGTPRFEEFNRKASENLGKIIEHEPSPITPSEDNEENGEISEEDKED